MKTSDNFKNDEIIVQIRNRLKRRRISGFDIDDFLGGDYSSMYLKRLAHDHRRQASALMLCAKANSRAADLRRDWERHETKRIEELIRSIPQYERYFLHGEDDGGQLEYIFNRLVAFSCLVGMDDETLCKAFSRKEIYFEIYENQHSRTAEDWRALVERHAAAGEC